MESTSSFLRRDRFTRVITNDGKFRSVVVNATKTSRTAQKNHGLDALSGYVLAQGLSVAAALASFLKGEERITLQFDGDGAVSSLFVESLQVGEVRGFVRLAEDAAEKVLSGSVASVLGRGMLKVSKILYGHFEPVLGIVAMPPETVAKTVAAYLSHSEQIPSAVIIDTFLDEHDGSILFSGALIVQSMPGALQEDIIGIENRIAGLPRLSVLADEGADAHEILRRVLGTGFDVLATSPVDFFCRCSLERFKTMLISVGIKEVSSMRSEGQNELVCQYCNKHYYLSDNDFDDMLALLKAKEN
jgi:molecular chaperone Hsp33